MTEIKSALELALERTQDIKSDKDTIKANEMKNNGKKMASQLLNPGDTTGNPLQDLKNYSGKEKQWVAEGFFQILLANFNLPANSDFGQKLETLEKGFLGVIKDKKQVNYIRQQVSQFFEQYLQGKQELADSLKQQYEPQLREKERMLAQQMGAQVHLTAESDPEFAALLAKNMSRLEDQYNEALQQVKEQMKQLFAKS